MRVGESEAYMLEPYLLEGVLDESEAYLLVPYLAEPDVRRQGQRRCPAPAARRRQPADGSGAVGR